MVRSEQRVFVRSGELIVGVLTGVSRPHEIGRGMPTRRMQRFNDFASCWKRWLDWPGWNRSTRWNVGQAMNKRARRIPNYDRRLTRPLKLADGTWLKTIKDAADYFAKQFSTVTAWGPLEIAVEMLITAGESGKRDDIDAATKQVEIVLRGRRLI